MKLKPWMALAASTAFVVAGIAVTMVTGLWQTESDKTPRKLADAPVAEASTDADAGTAAYDPADIRGSYTFGEISTLYGIPLADMARAFGLSDAEAEAFQTKTLEKRFTDAAEEIGTASVRLFARLYLGLPVADTETAWLPRSAADVLAERGNLTETQTAYLAEHTLP